MAAHARRMTIVIVICSLTAIAQTRDKDTWRFAVSGDSRNCGDVIMPAIAERARREGAAFYWHLGDLRAIFKIDEDMQQMAQVKKTSLTMDAYEKAAWDDFIQNQIAPFQKIPVYIGIGNHETIDPKNRDQFIGHFADWLDTPQLRDQRLKDNPRRPSTESLLSLDRERDRLHYSRQRNRGAVRSGSTEVVQGRHRP